ncbi:MAG: M48 family metallopeptidase [Deltaproteobacteria bacterium]|nr:M48 family metallopeptidase [Deltaproteobacteria bacterium]
MNRYAVFILAALMADYFIGLTADFLNLKNQKTIPPAEFSDLVDETSDSKNRDYLKANTILGQCSGTISLLVTLGFWFASGFNFLDQWCRAQTGNELLAGLLFIALLLLGNALLGLPFSIYSTFVIEERFGFNRTDWQTFVIDRVKGLFLALLLGTPLLAGIIWFFQSNGAWAWFYAWLAAAAFTLIIQLIAPIWIMPLFNKFTPLPEGELKEALVKYGEKVNFPLDQVFVVDGSKRSGKGNAFFTGCGRQRRVALYDTLIKQHSSAELIAVLAHEIGHYKKRHILKMTTIAIIHQAIIFFLMGWFIRQPGLYQAFFMEHASTAAGLIFFSLLFTPVEMLLNPLFLAISRRHEFQADSFAAQSIDAPETLIKALKKLGHDNLANLTPHPLYVLLHYSHPPLLARVNALRKPDL